MAPPVSTTTSTEVPGRLPIAIGGHAYLIDPAGFQRETVPVLRQQADQSPEPGEASLNPKGLWRRSQESWHHGAGQRFLDGKTDTGVADPHRFRTSRGVDPWTSGELSLLSSTVLTRHSTNTNLAVLVAGFNVYLVDGNELYFSSFPQSILNNGTFDVNTTGWANAYNTTVTHETTVVRTGAGAMRMTAVATDTMQVITPTGLSGEPVSPGGGYRVEFWSRAATVGRTIQVDLIWYTAAGASISTVSKTAADITGAWTPITVTAVAPATAAFAAVRITIVDANTGEVHYVDDATMRGAVFSTSVIQAGQAAQPVASVTSNGRIIWAALGTSGIHRTVNGATTSTADVPAAPGGGSIDRVAHVMGRLLATGIEAGLPTLWEIVNPLSAPALADGVNGLRFVHTDLSFTFAFISPGRNCIYIGGNVGGVVDIFTGVNLGGQAEVYRIGINPTDTSLTAPTFATYLPDGEAVYCLQFYAGGVIMGTSNGIRTATVDGQGNLDYGPIIETPGPVFALEPQGRYVWFSYLHLDSTVPGGANTYTSGLARLDLGYFTERLVPAWAPDLVAEPVTAVFGGTGVAQNPVTSIASYVFQAVKDAPHRRVFAVSTVGFFREDADGYLTPHRTASGTLDTGAIRYSTTERKTTRSLDVRHHALTGTVAAALKMDDATSFINLGTSSTAGSNGPAAPFSTDNAEGESAEVRFTLTRSTADTTDSPELVRWTLKALPIPRRDEIFTLPLVMHSYIDSTNGDGARTPQDVLAEISFLKGLERAGTIVKLQIGSETHDVFIDAISQQGMHWVDWAGTKVLQGTVVVRAQSVEG